jgi:polysaccharide export outer membrane protein
MTKRIVWSVFVSSWIALFLPLFALAQNPSPVQGQAAAKDAVKEKETVQAAPGDYRLGVKDCLIIDVWNKVELEFPTQDVCVDDDGNIALPIVEKVKVEGITVPELIEALKKRYAEFVLDPNIIIKIKEYKSHTVTIQGEVKTPGVYILEKKTYLVDIIAMAGGRTEKGSDRVQIFRKSAKGEETLLVDISKIGSGDPSSNIEVLPGDKINILPSEDMVYVYGEVRQPRSVPFRQGMTVHQAIIEAGGFTEDASKSRIKVLRDENGRVRKYKINLNDPENMRWFLKPGDTISVPKKIF